ncbi:Sorting nexin 1 [Ectocarpus siliculosus]|uniref:Sorting nexin 1 n=1 Tax=Ectocarpus siliculosus TaxID=2880 RepID=D8LM83_ECTSI|nr:Sorting nexin 1 [Ectocarpus siliculosus]|eukprot:CBN79716.1 Sorting nexin 1 [Ectocarpus siliculosus]
MSNGTAYPDVLSNVDMPGRSAPAAAAGSRLNITVCDPVKQDQGINAYITYKVHTSTDRPDFQYGQFTVIRRFKDFVWLSHRLEEEFPGMVMPALPVKMVVGKFDQTFVEKRRKELEIFLNRVAAHGELSASQYFKTFLQADDAGLADTKDKEKAERVPVGPHHVLRWFGEVATHVKTQVDKAKKEEISAKTPADIKFEEMQQYANNLDVQMQNVARHTTALVKKQEQLGSTMFEFGVAFTLLANAEEDKAPLGQALLQLAHAADEVSVQVKKQAQQEAEHFEGPVLEYGRMTTALKTALHKRNEKKITYMTAAHDLEAKKAHHSKVAGLGGDRQDRVAAAEDAVATSTTALDKARRQYEEVSDRVVREFARFRRDKAADMKKIILDYVNVQVEATKKQEEAWQALIPHIEAMELEGSGEGDGTGMGGPDGMIGM